MAKKKKTGDGNDFPDKWLNKLPEGYTETAEALSTDDLQKEIIKAEGLLADEEKAMEGDLKLQSLKDDIQALSGGYKDAMNCQRAKTRYCLHLMRLRGAR